jgi:hypothetical protein
VISSQNEKEREEKMWERTREKVLLCLSLCLSLYLCLTIASSPRVPRPLSLTIPSEREIHEDYVMRRESSRLHEMVKVLSDWLTRQREREMERERERENAEIETMCSRLYHHP